MTDLMRRALLGAASAMAINVPAVLRSDLASANTALSLEVADLEARCIVGVDGVCNIAPNGEEFVTLTSGGIKAHGDSAKSFPTAMMAVAAWARQAHVYVSKRAPLDLYWRERPALEQAPDLGWYVWSRLVIGHG